MMTEQRVDTELQDFRRRFGVPAVGVAIVGADGETTVRVDGRLSRNSDEAVDEGDLWHIGSCGKAMTAAVYARLVEGGHADWDSSLGGFFPDLSPHPGWMGRTVAEALTCQAGIGSNPGRRDMKAAYSDTRPGVVQRLEATRGALGVPPDNPGRFRYSNLGYVVVGSIIERITGSSYEEALRSLLLGPLGITTGGFGPPPRVWGHRGRAHMVGVVAGRGSPVPPGEARGDNPSLLSPAGRLHLSLGDWALFHRMILNRGDSLLRPETVELLLTVPPEGTMSMGWAPARELAGIVAGMQGSNTMWSASALIAEGRSMTAMVAANDGRTRVLVQSAYLAHRLLTGTSHS